MRDMPLNLNISADTKYTPHGINLVGRKLYESTDAGFESSIYYNKK